MKTCQYCGKQLRKAPYHEGHGYDGNGFFCTLRCGFAWAVREKRVVDLARRAAKEN